MGLAGGHSTNGLAMKLIAKLKAGGKNLWQQLNRDNLHFRIFRCVIATIVTVIIALLPGIKAIYGPTAYLGSMTTVLGHPGRRLGGMIEALGLGLIGISVGVAWSSLGVYLGSLCYEANRTATMGIRAIFLIVPMFVHGYVRSSAPRLFVMVLLMVVPVVFSMTSTNFYTTSSFVTALFYPMLTAIAVLLIVNICIFPEFGATGLGLTTVETLQQIITALNDASDLFVESCGRLALAPQGHQLHHHNRMKNPNKKVVRLAELTASKPTLRAKVAECKSVYRDCAFDISYSCLAPKELKPITSGIDKLVMSVMALIGACESKYALMGTAEYSMEEKEAFSEGPSKQLKGSTKEGKDNDMGRKGEKEKEKKENYVPALKVKRAIEGGDQQLLRYLLNRVAVPVNTLQQSIDRSIDVISTCVAIVYEIPKLPSLKQAGEVRHPAGVLLQELDIYIDCLSAAITAFAETSAQALEGAAKLQELSDKDEGEVDIMPRDEVFLISSFLLNIRLAASQTLDMLKHSRVLVEARMERNKKKGFHWPDVGLRRWLSTSSEETEAPSASEPQRSQDDDDDEEDDVSAWGNTLVDPGSRDRTATAKAQETERRISREKKRKLAKEKLEKESMPLSLKIRGVMADFVEWIKTSDHVLYAFKFTFGVTLVTWPSFVHDWTLWYERARAVWVAIIFILMFENAVGSTVWMIFLRGAGTVLGSTLGYAAYESGHGNPITMGVLLLILIIPAYYVQLGTKYQKAGMIFTVSICVVSITTHLQTVPGTSFENFYKRACASLISGGVALLVHVTLFPVKARSKLRDCLGTAISQINLMESCVALGVDENRVHMLKHPRYLKRFEHAAKNAKAALSSAEAFLEFARHEPRVKGKWEPHALIYKEIIFVLRQIVERMENLFRLRIAFGSAVLEEFNARVHGYRRNVAAAITLTLCAVQQSLTQKLPLPQFLPSARLANLRMVVRVRQILHEESAFTAATPLHGSVKDQSDTEDEANENEITSIGVSTPPPISVSASASSAAVDAESSTTGHKSTQRKVLRLKILSWNAGSAALEECIEYVEELVDLAKLLVGVNEFRSGLLHRPTFREYLGDIYSVTPVKGGSGMESTTAGTVGTSTVGGSRVADGNVSARGREGRARGVGNNEATSGCETATVSLHPGDLEDRENRDVVNALARTPSAVPTLPHALARIQSRREAERIKRKHE